jgi:hypothetical protein
VFIFTAEPYPKEAIQRRKRDTLDEEAGVEFYFSSPEDIILNKLQWYNTGDRLSERQWVGTIGVIKIQGSVLDKKYLTKWAKNLDLLDLLEKAFREARVY